MSISIIDHIKDSTPIITKLKQQFKHQLLWSAVRNAASDSVSDPANGALGPFVGIIAADNAFLSPAVQAAAPGGGNQKMKVFKNYN